MLVQDQAAATRTFETVTESDSGRSLTSAMVLESTRTDTGHTELEVRTSHSPRYGYTVAVARPRVSGYTRHYVLSFHDEGKPALTLTLPQGKTRFNRNTLASIHAAARQAVEADFDTWLAWAEQANTSL